MRIMSNNMRAILACGLVSVGAITLHRPAHSSEVQTLKAQLSRKEKEITALKARVRALEKRKSVGQVRPPASEERKPEVPRGFDTSEVARNGEKEKRALERALVQEGAAVLQRFELEATPSMGASLWDKSRPTLNLQTVTTTMALTLGLPLESQLRVAWPYSWTNTKAGRVTSGGNIDIAFGKQILNEGPFIPAIVVNGGVAFPPEKLPTDGRLMNLGPRSYYGGLSLTKRFDPIVLVSGISVTKSDPQLMLGSRYTSPLTWSAHAGGALALSPQMSMRAAFILSRQENIGINGVMIPNSNLTSGSFTLGLNTVISRSLMLSLAATTRILGPGPNLTVTVALPYRF